MSKQHIVLLVVSVAVAVVVWSNFADRPQSEPETQAQDKAKSAASLSKSLSKTDWPRRPTRPEVPVPVRMEGVVPTNDAQMKDVLRTVHERVSKRGFATHIDVQEAHQAIRGRLEEIGPSAVEQLIADFNVDLAKKVSAMPTPGATAKATPTDQPPRRPPPPEQ